MSTEDGGDTPVPSTHPEFGDVALGPVTEPTLRRCMDTVTEALKEAPKETVRTREHRATGEPIQLIRLSGSSRTSPGEERTKESFNIYLEGLQDPDAPPNTRPRLSVGVRPYGDKNAMGASYTGDLALFTHGRDIPHDPNDPVERMRLEGGGRESLTVNETKALANYIHTMFATSATAESQDADEALANIIRTSVANSPAVSTQHLELKTPDTQPPPYHTVSITSTITQGGNPADNDGIKIEIDDRNKSPYGHSDITRTLAISPEGIPQYKVQDQGLYNKGMRDMFREKGLSPIERIKKLRHAIKAESALHSEEEAMGLHDPIPTETNVQDITGLISNLSTLKK